MQYLKLYAIVFQACLCLSQVYHAMGNISKARANITTAKTEALKIYTPPDMQGELDLQSGVLIIYLFIG